MTVSANGDTVKIFFFLKIFFFELFFLNYFFFILSGNLSGSGTLFKNDPNIKLSSSLGSSIPPSYNPFQQTSQTHKSYNPFQSVAKDTTTPQSNLTSPNFQKNATRSFNPFQNSPFSLSNNQTALNPSNFPGYSSMRSQLQQSAEKSNLEIDPSIKIHPNSQLSGNPFHLNRSSFNIYQGFESNETSNEPKDLKSKPTDQNNSSPFPGQSLFYGRTALQKSTDFGSEENPKEENNNRALQSQYPFSNFNNYNVYNNPYSSQLNPYSYVNKNFGNFNSTSPSPSLDHSSNLPSSSPTPGGNTSSQNAPVSSSLPPHEQNVLNEYIKILSNDYRTLSQQEESEIVLFLRKTSKLFFFF